MEINTNNHSQSHLNNISSNINSITLHDIKNLYQLNDNIISQILYSLLSCNSLTIELLYNKLSSTYVSLNNQFALRISSLDSHQQFIYTMQRWSEQIHFAEFNLNYIKSNTNSYRIFSNKFQSIRLPFGSYIKSLNSSSYYLNLGVNSKTLQGAIYYACEYHPSFINQVLDNGGDYSILLRKQATLAIKYYDYDSCKLGCTLNGVEIRENHPLKEMKMTKYINNNSSIYKSLNNWLPEPYQNIIKFVDYWLDIRQKCYFMVTEYANCGELLSLIKMYHNVYYKRRPACNDNVLCSEHSNGYIELIRYLFQQMVQAIYVLHSLDILHLDISLENFVIHYSSSGKLLVKLIDFGRSKLIRNNTSKDYLIGTYTGKSCYMSGDSAMFLKYKNAKQYNGSREDIYALGVVLFSMLTNNLPYFSPFYLDDNGKLNGDNNYNLRNNNININLDSNFAILNKYGVRELLTRNDLLSYITPQSLSLLNDIFNKNLSINQLIQHPFVNTASNPQLLITNIKCIVNIKSEQFNKNSLFMNNKIFNLKYLYKNIINIQTNQIMIKYQLQLKLQQQHNQQQKQQHNQQCKQQYLKPPASSSLSCSLLRNKRNQPNLRVKLPQNNNNNNNNNVFTQLNLTNNLISPSPPPKILYTVSPRSPPITPKTANYYFTNLCNSVSVSSQITPKSINNNISISPKTTISYANSLSRNDSDIESINNNNNNSPAVQKLLQNHFKTT